jgi:hypothetical protein
VKDLSRGQKRFLVLFGIGALIALIVGVEIVLVVGKY